MQITREQFDEMVQGALNHLYDSPNLEGHPLTQLLTDPEADAPRRCQQMRRLLLDSIRLLHPKPGVPAQSPDWRAYRILELRYIEGQDGRQVMEQVALSKSQYYREQTRVVGLVAAILWDRWREKPPTQGDSYFTDALVPAQDARYSLAESEAERLSAQANWGPVEVGDVLRELQTYVEPLARAKSAKITFHASESFTIGHADRILLRQAILNVITYGLDLADQLEGKARLFVNRQHKGIRLTFHGQSSSTVTRTGVGLNVCRQLLKKMGGRLDLQNIGTDSWEARLSWAEPEPHVLLVVDDNASFIDLFRRYLNNSPWRVIGATSGIEARHLLREIHPSTIILDVMMPQEDGWETLRSLRNDPLLSAIPIVICSVLHEPELARTLGASAYLLKPITQQDLLHVLQKDLQDAANQAPER